MDRSDKTAVATPAKRKRPPARGPNAPKVLYPLAPTSIPKELIEAAVEKALAELRKEYEED